MSAFPPASPDRKNGFVDLHMHTTASDGVSSPAEVLELVREAKLVSFAVTDHDSFEGAREMRALLKEDDPELICGVELSAGETGEDLHILAYFFENIESASDSPLAQALEEFRRKRGERGARIVERMQELELPLTMDDVLVESGASAIGRAHIAAAMAKSGASRTYQEAFDKWIGYGRPGYIPKENLRPDHVIRLTHEAGGVAVLAHPAINAADKALPRLLGCGLDGVEVYHPANPYYRRQEYLALTRANNLLVSGGSDYHGRDDRHGQIGQEKVHAELVEKMRERARQYR